MEHYIDLHMHSMYSNDGNLTPEELVDRCKAAGIRIMAIADHNSSKACAAGAAAAGKEGMTCIPAIEIDCTHRPSGTNLHVLGYGIDAADPGFLRLEQELADQERASSRPRLDILEGMGLVIDEEKAYSLAHYGYVTGEVICEVALADPRNDGNPLLLPYREGGARSDNPYVNFYWDLCSPGKPAWVPITFISLEEALDLITRTGGIPVLAHPGNNVKEDDALLDAVLRSGIRGIEVYSTYHSPAQVAYYRAKAEEYGLLVTCGSDYHGKTKPSIFLGRMDCGGEEESIEAGLRAAGVL